MLFWVGDWPIHEDVSVVSEWFFTEETSGEEVRVLILESGVVECLRSRWENGKGVPWSGSGVGGGVTHGHGPRYEIVGSMASIHVG